MNDEIKSIFGCYAPVDNRFQAVPFYTKNTTALAKLFGIEKDELEIVYQSIPASDSRFLICTPKCPLVENEQPPNMGYKLRIFYNLPAIKDYLIEAETQGVECLAGVAWCFIAEIFRTYMILEGKISDNEHIGPERFAQFDLNVTYNKALENFMNSNWTAQKFRLEMDIVFIYTYIAQTITTWAIQGKKFDLEEVARIIKETTNTNINITPLAKIGRI